MEWKKINGFDNYFISNTGIVKNNKLQILKCHGGSIELYKFNVKYRVSANKLLWSHFTFYEVNPIEILQGEIWTLVPNYPMYYISTKGRVFSCLTNKVLKPRAGNFNYLYVNLSNNKRKSIRIHRLVAIAFIKKVEGKNYVNHIDSNPQNNCVENLEWCTIKENLAHCRIKNRHSKGETNGSSKLKTSDIIEIRKLYVPRKMSMDRISKLYNVSQAAIYDIIHGITWIHVK